MPGVGNGNVSARGVSSRVRLHGCSSDEVGASGVTIDPTNFEEQWILLSGAWNDEGIWVDSAEWNDGV